MTKRIINKGNFQAVDFVQFDDSDYVVLPNGEIFAIIYESVSVNGLTSSKMEMMIPSWFEWVEPHMCPDLWEEILLRSSLVEVNKL